MKVWTNLEPCRVPAFVAVSLSASLVIVMAFGFGCTPSPNSVGGDTHKLQGVWQLVYQQMNGKKLPDEEAANIFHGRMAFVGDKMRYTVELPG